MYKLSDIVSKQVIVLSSAQLLGTITDALLSPDLKKAESFILIDPEEESDEYMRLKTSEIFCIGEDAVVVRALSRPPYGYAGKTNNPMGKQCYGAHGKLLGRISDIELDESFAVSSFTLGENVFEPSSLLRSSETLVIFNDGEDEFPLPKPKVRRPASSKKTTVKAAVLPKATGISQTENSQQPPDENDSNNETGESNAATVSKAASPESSAHAIVATPTGALGRDEYDTRTVDTPTALPPDRLHAHSPDFSFLIGSHMTRPLYSSSGKLIAPAGAVITPEIISDAATDGKLVQLTLRALK